MVFITLVCGGVGSGEGNDDDNDDDYEHNHIKSSNRHTEVITFS